MACLVEAKRNNPQTGRTESYFRIAERKNGRQVTIALGFISRKEAENLLRVHEAQALVAPQQQPAPPSTPLLRDYIPERVLTSCRASGLAEKSIVSARTSEKHIVRILGHLRLDQIRKADGDHFCATRKNEGAKSRTIQIELGWLKKAMDLAVEDGHISAPPTFKKPPNTDARPHVFLSEDQSILLLKNLPWQQDPVSSLAIYMALDLGLRKGELLSRRWEDVRLQQGQQGALWVGTRVENGEVTWKTKTKSSRTIPLTPGLRMALEEELIRQGQPTTGWVFPSPKIPENPLGTFRGTLVAACKRAGLPVLHPHALRHTWATRMAVKGVPRPITMALGGWKSPSVLETVYQHSVSELEAGAIAGAALPKVERGTEKGGKVVHFAR